jgi:hypothetical protein
MALVGFWRQTQDSTEALPFPVADTFQADNRSVFVQKFKLIIHTAEYVGYKGVSMCRLCNKYNGSRETTWNGYVFPHVLLHYVEDHGVAVPKEFYDDVMAS